MVAGDDLVITPGPLRPGRVETYDDHRVAMSFGLLGLVTEGIEIANPGVVGKTWPLYWEMLENLARENP
jgi:3-phosphoshikimate 1-carboxyvinyltransferase